MNNARSCIFMVLAMGAFTIEDMLIKAVSQTVSIGLVLALFGLGGTFIFVFLTKRRREPIFDLNMLSRPVLVRAMCEVVGRIAYALAITLSALSSASAILQATPLMAMIGAAFFFNERIDLKRWVAACVGFVGVLMIIRPGVDSFEAASVFAVIATIGFAGRDLATRAASSALSNVQLGVYGFCVLIPTGLAMHWYHPGNVAVDGPASIQIIGAVIFGVVAYNALTIAMRTGDVSLVSPFRYTRLLFAMIIGILVFHETPDEFTIAGSVFIVLSGVYILMHHRKSQIKLSAINLAQKHEG